MLRAAGRTEQEVLSYPRGRAFAQCAIDEEREERRQVVVPLRRGGRVDLVIVAGRWGACGHRGFSLSSRAARRARLARFNRLFTVPSGTASARVSSAYDRP